MSSSSTVRPIPLSSLQVSRHFIPASPPFPNTALNTSLPLLIYHRCFPPSSTPGTIEAHLRAVGVVEPAWRYPMYREHHYHSTAHEVLVVSRGSATLCFGGADNGRKVLHEAEKGDVFVVPAGVAHAMLEDKGEYELVGSYAVGAAQWDHQTGKLGKAGEERVRGLGWFKRDPIYGDEGPALDEL